LGDCIDCTLCVHARPTGNDIRQGLQYQCNSRAACDDASDQEMEKMNYPQGLIRYTTENALEGNPTRLLRPRVLIYATLLVGIFSALLVAIALRTPLELDIIRDRNVLYREVEMGLISNVYTLKLLNMDQQAHTYTLSVSGIEGLMLETGQSEFAVAPGGVLSTAISLKVDPVALKQASSEVQFTLQAVDDPGLKVTETARFVGPVIR
jgi:cytochrome c oxidase accessory protein FixG